jgi:hypothetical protein
MAKFGLLFLGTWQLAPHSKPLNPTAVVQNKYFSLDFQEREGNIV